MNINGINFKSEMLEDYIVKTSVDKNMCGITGVYAMCYMSMPQNLQSSAESPLL